MRVDRRPPTLSLRERKGFFSHLAVDHAAKSNFWISHVFYTDRQNSFKNRWKGPFVGKLKLSCHSFNSNF